MITKDDLLLRIEGMIGEGFDLLRKLEVGYSEKDFDAKRKEILNDCEEQIKDIETETEQEKLIDYAFERASHYD